MDPIIADYIALIMHHKDEIITKLWVRLNPPTCNESCVAYYQRLVGDIDTCNVSPRELVAYTAEALGYSPLNRVWRCIQSSD